MCRAVVDKPAPDAGAQSVGRSNMLRLFAATLVVVCCAGAASASTTTFTSRAAFDGAFSTDSTYSVQDWDGYAVGTTFTNGVFVDGIAYNSSVNLAVVTNTFAASTSPNSLGRTPIDFFALTDTISFTFATPVTFFGIDVNTFDGVDGGFEATTNGGDVISSVFDAFPGFATGQFVGFSSTTAFSSVTIASVGGFSYTLDTMRYGGVENVVIPLPTGAAMAGFGLLGLSIRRRRAAF